MSFTKNHHSFLNLLPRKGQVNVNLPPLPFYFACIFFRCSVQIVKLGCKMVQNQLYQKVSSIFEYSSFGELNLMLTWPPHSILLLSFFSVGCKMSNLGTKRSKMCFVGKTSFIFLICFHGGAIYFACIFFVSRAKMQYLGEMQCKMISKFSVLQLFGG